MSERKIIQISTVSVPNTMSTQCDALLYALCNDGTLWWATDRHPKWNELPSIPQPHPKDNDR